MKRLFQLFYIALLFCTSCGTERLYYLSTSFHEPADAGLRFIYSKDGLRWDSIPGVWLKPEVGTQQIMRDPSIVLGPDSIFRLVWTSSWKHDLGYGYCKSTDLIDWDKQHHMRVMANDTTAVNVWAPEITYDPYTEQYIMVWASCVPYRFPKGIEDERNNHRLYYTITKDFKKFTRQEVLYDPGFSVIDATFVCRGANDYVMVFKDNTRPERNLRVAFASKIEGPYSDPSEPFTDSFCEGPTVAKVGDWYYIYYDAYKKKSFGATKTRDFKTFIDASSEISVPVGHKHGTMIRVPATLVEKMLAKRAVQ